MPYEEDPNSFLFGLNQFTSPPADQQNDSGASSEMLAGLEAFASDDLGAPSQGDAAPNFADQLALWTNANFSFDGPTGHALIGDEEKEKEEAENNRRREEENRRNEADNRERMARNAAASSRGGNAARGKAREMNMSNEGANEQGNGSGQQPSAAQQQQQQQQLRNFLGGPVQAKSSQGLVAGYGDQQRPPQLPNGHVSPRQLPQQAAPGAPGGFPPFFNGFAGFHQFGGLGAQQPPAAGHMGGMGGLDMTSALALQHLLASNPLALASLGQFAGFANPQLQAHLASLAGNNMLGAGMGAFGQPPMQGPNVSQAPSPWEAQQQDSRQGSTSSVPGAANGWPPAGVVPGPNGMAPTPGPSVAPSPADTAPAFGAGMFGAAAGNAVAGSTATSRTASTSQAAAATESKASESGPSKKKRVSVSNGKKSTAASDENSDDNSNSGQKFDDDKKYEIPPLKLIDTGNPEADAEANRLAIEEDKRRRNTAASARFRVKKKQREAALENTAKELQQRVADLESENARLRTENGWLKSLITVQPGQTSAAAGPSAAAAAAAAAAFGAGAAAGPSRPPASQPPAVQPSPRSGPVPSREQPSDGGPVVANGASSSSNQPAQEQTERDSGLVPRGVGTEASAQKKKDGNTNTTGSSAALKRDREE